MSDVVIETDRLIIRDVTMPDGEAFIHMASDGSLNDVGFLFKEKKMYRDVNDANEELYRFYLAQRNQQIQG